MRLGLGLGLSNYRPPTGPVVQLLRSLFLSNASVSESSAQGVTVGAILNTRDGSTLSITNTAGSRFALSGGNIVRGATALDYETATSHQITLRETNAAYPNSPRDTVITISVTNVFEQPDLGALALSASEVTQGQAATVNITGATTGSTITGAVPDGLTLNSAARTITGTPTVVGSYNFTLTETLADSANSPRANSVSLAVAAPDTTPDAFDLGGPFEGEPDEIIFSNEQTLAGVASGVAIPASLSGGHGGCCRIERFNGSTWDNLGTETTLFLGDLWRVRTRAHEMVGSSFTLTATVGGVSDSMDVATVAVADVGVNAPTLTKTNAAGDPLEFDVTVDETVAVGMYWRLQLAGNDAFTAPLTGESAIREEFRIITSDDFANGPLFEILDQQPAGEIFARLRVERDDGEISDWSNTVTETIEVAVENATEWASTTGPNKSQYVSVSGTPPLTATGQSGFNSAPIGVRGTQARSGKRQFQVTVTVAAAFTKFYVGADNGTDNLADQGTTNFSVPGKSNATGVVLQYSGDGPVIYAGGSAVFTGAAQAFVTGDVFTVEFDTDAGTASFYRNGTKLGNTVTGLAFSTLSPFVSFETNHSALAKFDAGQARTLSSGYVPFDN